MDKKKLFVASIVATGLLGVASLSNSPRVFAETSKEELVKAFDQLENDAIARVNQMDISEDAKAKMIAEIKEELGKEDALKLLNQGLTPDQIIDELMDDAEKDPKPAPSETILKDEQGNVVGTKSENGGIPDDVKQKINEQNEKDANKSEKEKLTEKVDDLKDRKAYLEQKATEIKESVDNEAKKLSQAKEALEKAKKEGKTGAELAELEKKVEEAQLEFNEVYAQATEELSQVASEEKEVEDALEEAEDALDKLNVANTTDTNSTETTSTVETTSSENTLNSTDSKEATSETNEVLPNTGTTMNSSLGVAFAALLSGLCLVLGLKKQSNIN